MILSHSNIGADTAAYTGTGPAAAIVATIAAIAAAIALTTDLVANAVPSIGMALLGLIAPQVPTSASDGTDRLPFPATTTANGQCVGGGSCRYMFVAFCILLKFGRLQTDG